MNERILLHDFSGHPFQVELARELARRGDRVLAVNCGSILTPKGAISRREDDPSTFDAMSIATRRPLNKYNLARRMIQELEYGFRLGRIALRFRPEVVISSNEPPLVRAIVTILCATALRRCASVLWLQDVYGTAGADLFGGGVGRLIDLLERWSLRRAGAVVVISADFVDHVARAGVERARISVVENWAPLREIVPREKDTAWSRSHGLVDHFVFLYSGTLGRKHDLDPLLALCHAFEDDAEVVVLVVSEGEGAAALAEVAAREGITNLRQLPFQPYDQLSDVIGAANVVLAFLRAEAAAYSVPSKILSYMSAGACILVAIPGGNAASRLLERRDAGVVVREESGTALTDEARALRFDADRREHFRCQSRAAAEAEFDVGGKAEGFARAISVARTKSSRRRPWRRTEM